MKKKKLLIFIGAALLFFLLALASIPNNGDKKLSDLSGVILAPPQGYTIVALENQGRELTDRQAAQELQGLIERYPAEKKLALKFSHSGADGYIMVDLEKDFIQKIAANEFGTVVQTTWRGSARERLRWRLANGDFTPEGFAEPVSRNLYH